MTLTKWPELATCSLAKCIVWPTPDGGCRSHFRVSLQRLFGQKSPFSALRLLDNYRSNIGFMFITCIYNIVPRYTVPKPHYIQHIDTYRMVCRCWPRTMYITVMRMCQQNVKEYNISW